MLTRQMDDGVGVSFQHLPRQKIGERRTRLKDSSACGGKTAWCYANMSFSQSVLLNCISVSHSRVPRSFESQSESGSHGAQGMMQLDPDEVIPGKNVTHRSAYVVQPQVIMRDPAAEPRITRSSPIEVNNTLWQLHPSL